MSGIPLVSFKPCVLAAVEADPLPTPVPPAPFPDPPNPPSPPPDPEPPTNVRTLNYCYAVTRGTGGNGSDGSGGLGGMFPGNGGGADNGARQHTDNTGIFKKGDK